MSNILKNFGDTPTPPPPDPSSFVSESEVSDVQRSRKERREAPSCFVPFSHGDKQGRLLRIHPFPDQVFELYGDRKPDYLTFVKGVYEETENGFGLVEWSSPVWIKQGIPFEHGPVPTPIEEQHGKPNGLPCCYRCGMRLFYTDRESREYCGLCQTPKFWIPAFAINVANWFLKEGVGFDDWN